MMTQHISPQRIGIELEFSGLPEAQVADLLSAFATQAPESTGHRRFAVETAPFGRCEVYLDTRFAEDAERLAGPKPVDLARLVVPVEVVTAPFDVAHLPLFDGLVAKLRNAGAIGSRDGLLLGFGVHLNIEMAQEDVAHLWQTVTAYALLEDWLRATGGVDLSRRLLPFIRPYPAALVDDLSAGCPNDLEGLIATYLHHAPTRDHGLDMLPIFKYLRGDLVDGKIKGGTATKPRPAYHFRLPDCRIDEADWSIQIPWGQWQSVERLARARPLFDRLRAARRDWSGQGRLSRRAWADVVADALGQPAAGVAQ